MRESRRRRWFRPAVALLFCVVLAGCKTELLTDVSQRQANEAISLLLRHHIDAQKVDVGKGKFRIEVDRDSFSDAVNLLEKFRLPSQDDIAIADLFPADSFVNSPATERARLISGLELRLEQTARAIDDVLSARVHISYSLTDSTNDARPLHVSMMLNYHGSLSDAVLIQRLKQLVKNSFESLSYDNISVVIFRSAPETIDVPVVSATAPWAHQQPWLGALAGALMVASALIFYFWCRRRLHARTPQKFNEQV